MTPEAFETELSRRAGEVQQALQFFLHAWKSEKATALTRLVESMSYSALGNGKRVRPILALWTAEALGGTHEQTLPWAMAIEMIHTYSLIHDDLPCMDDDKERRGRPTNHIVYGEATALLAGDSLLTEAFGHLARSYRENPTLVVALIEKLAHDAGVNGMIGGQALDLAAEGAVVDLEDLQQMHRMKTGALIAVSVEGAALCSNVTPELQKNAREFGEALGLAFQIADDILDSHEEGQEGRSYVHHMGIDGARKELKRVSEHASALLKQFPKEHPDLQALVDWNCQRQK